MAIYDNNGTTNYEIGKLYDNNGTTNSQISKVYDNNGTTNSLIYQTGFDWMEQASVLNSSNWGASGQYVVSAGNIGVPYGSSSGSTLQSSYDDIPIPLRDYNTMELTCSGGLPNDADNGNCRITFSTKDSDDSSFVIHLEGVRKTVTVNLKNYTFTSSKGRVSIKAQNGNSAYIHSMIFY